MCSARMVVCLSAFTMIDPNFSGSDKAMNGSSSGGVVVTETDLPNEKGS